MDISIYSPFAEEVTKDPRVNCNQQLEDDLKNGIEREESGSGY